MAIEVTLLTYNVYTKYIKTFWKGLLHMEIILMRNKLYQIISTRVLERLMVMRLTLFAFNLYEIMPTLFGKGLEIKA